MTTLNKKIGLIQPGTVKAGDLPGHPFRGNQWTDGEGGGTGTVGHAQRMGPLGGAPTHTTRAERRQKTREKLTRHDLWSAEEYNTLASQGLTDKQILDRWDKEAKDAAGSDTETTLTVEPGSVVSRRGGKELTYTYQTKPSKERALDAFAANGGNMDIYGPSRITHLWKQEGIAGTDSEVHTLGNDLVDITVVRGPNVLGEDTYSISYKDVYFGTEKVKWANEDFPASKQGLQDALRYAQDNQDRFADSFKPTRRKKGKRSKGPGISYSIYD